MANTTATAQWSINTKGGERIVAFTSFISAEVNEAGKVVSTPIEEGSFASYNKVDEPLTAKVQLGLQGDDATLQDALDKLRELRKGTELVSLVMPFVEYQKLNLEALGYQIKTENGVGCLYADLSLVEIRETTTQYSNRTMPRKNRGKVQPQSNNQSFLDKGKKQFKEWF